MLDTEQAFLAIRYGHIKQFHKDIGLASVSHLIEEYRETGNLPQYAIDFLYEQEARHE